MFTVTQLKMRCINVGQNLLGGKYEDAAKEFLDIENKTRRQQNYQMFINGDYDSTH